MKLTREVKIGILVLTTFIMIIWGINYLKGRDIFSSDNKYYGVYSRVDGLTDSSPIYYKGFKVGNVRDIQLHPTIPFMFLVTFTINEKVKFPSNTVAEIYSADIMGAKAIQFIPGNSTEFLLPDATLQSSIRVDIVDQMSSQVLPLKEKTEKLIVKLDSTLTQIGTFLDADTKQVFDASLRDLSTTMSNMATISKALSQQVEQGGDIQQLINHINSIAQTIDSKKQVIGKTIDNFSTLSQTLTDAKLDKTIKELDSTITSLKTTIQGVDQGEGTLGMMLKDKELYNNLNSATENLNNVLVDFKANPKRYVSISAIQFGGKKSKEEEINKTNDVIYQILLTTSKTPLNISEMKSLPGMTIKEETDGKTYQYKSEASQSYIEMQTTLETIKDEYPHAEIIASEKGKIITISKALKKTQQL